MKAATLLIACALLGGCAHSERLERIGEALEGFSEGVEAAQPPPSTAAPTTCYLPRYGHTADARNGIIRCY